MKTKRLAIRNPCNEKWAEMTPQEQGRHCIKCDKVVIDLTAEDVRTAFQRVAESKAKLCVRILPHHLDYVHREYAEQSRRDFSLKAIAAGAALITFASLSSCAQETHSVRGEVAIVKTVVTDPALQSDLPASLKYRLKVLDEETKLPVENAIVVLFHGTISDTLECKNGNCSFVIPEAKFRVVIKSPGYQNRELTQADFNSEKATVVLYRMSEMLGEIYIAPEEE